MNLTNPNTQFNTHLFFAGRSILFNLHKINNKSEIVMNSFGRIFKVQIFGESHGELVGVLIDGCPAGMELSAEDFTNDIERRKTGGRGSSKRTESDVPEIKSGFFNGKTTGAPILINFKNENVRSADYDKMKNIPRPGHADFTAAKKYGGYNDYRGGGHFSGRLTLGLVAAGVIAKKVITPVEIDAEIVTAGGKKDMERAIDKAIREGDSTGGLIECKAGNVPIGLGEPFFDSVESLISHIIFSIPAVKGIEFGSGFSSAVMKGSEHNDEIIDKNGKTKTNNAGGINGGITNGNDIFFRAAIKPTPSISKKQKSINMETGKQVDLSIKGRHDVCIALRMPVIVEAVTAIVLADLMMLEQKIPGVL